MRVAIITETFAPDLNGAAHSVARAAEHLTTRGHDLVVIAPEPPDGVQPAFDYPVVRVPSLPMVGYPAFRVGLPSRRVVETLAAFEPHVVHLAAPFAFGAYGLAAAMRMGLPTVAVYQTDVPRFAAGYRLGFAEEAAWRWVRRIHSAADRTLAPSRDAIDDLSAHGVDRIHLWRRGVDTERFQPRRRDETFCQTVQEALASGLPVVAPDRGGPRDLVAHGAGCSRSPMSSPGRWRAGSAPSTR